MKQKKIFLSLAIIILSNYVFAGDAENILRFRVRQPKVKTEKPPLLILLHGIGSNEDDLFSFADRLPENFLIISARAPIELALGSYAWFEVILDNGKRTIDPLQAEESRKTIIRFIEALKKEYSFDEKKVYLCGFSQGAIMSYSVALTRPDMIHGIAIMSGRLLEEVKQKIAPKENLKQLKIFISHGTADQTLEINYARSAVAYLKSLKLDPVYKEYSATHEINNAMFEDLVKWISESSDR